MPMVNTSACLRDGVNVSRNERRERESFLQLNPSRSPPSPPLAGDEGWLSARIPFCFSLNLSRLFFSFHFFSVPFCLKRKKKRKKENCTLKKEKGKNEQVAVATCIKNQSSFLCTVAK